jgi:hypothetical protein
MHTLRTTTLLLALTVAASAQSFNVDFAGAPGALQTSYGAAAGQAGVWNGINPVGASYVSPTLLTTSGATSGVVLEFDSLGGFGLWTIGANEPNTFGDDQALLDDCYFNAGPSLLTIRGLAPGDYRLLTYAMAPDYGMARTGVNVAGSLDPLQVVGGDFSAGFARGVTHAEHRISVTGGAAVVIDFSIVASLDSINGLQITLNELGTNYCTANLNSTGQTGLIIASGSVSVAANDLTLEASRLPNYAFGYFLTSSNQASVPNPGGSLGVLCLGGNIGRYTGPGQIQNTGTTGAFYLLLDLSQVPTPSGFVSAAVGETRNFQAWHRDSVGGAAVSNLTNGLQVTFN